MTAVAASAANKYDRQLRLWGDEGQLVLMSSHILLINAGPTGSETLKNLVLPGIGRFTILDHRKVCNSDIGNNFFIHANSIGESRAKITTQLLMELNSDVSGDYRESDLADIIKHEPEYFGNFNLIIATQLSIQLLNSLASLCYEKNYNLLVLRSYGLIGYLRSVIPNHTVLDSKPDNQVEALHIYKPFDTLENHALSIDFQNLSSVEHGHIPYVIILIQLMKKWKDAHGGLYPSTFDEKNEFKASIQREAIGEWGNELNFVEAYENAYQAYVPPELPYTIQNLMEQMKTMDLKQLDLQGQTTKFWILVKALTQYIEKEGHFPISGKIPDMTSTTEAFLALQQIYEVKSKEDVATFQSYVHKVLLSCGLSKNTFCPIEIAKFCKKASVVEACSMRSIQEEYEKPNEEEIQTHLLDDQVDTQSPLLWYFLLRAADLFHDKNGCYPGELENSMESDSMAVQEIANLLLKNAGLDDDKLISKDHFLELTRYGGAEIHTIAAVIGGIASQEAVKILTRQYSPLDNTYIFNGITGSAAVYQL